MKTYVVCHMCTTIDGKILGERWEKLPGGVSSSKLFDTTANTFGIKAWLVGTTTMREFSHRPFALPTAKEEIARVDYVAEPKAKSFGICTDAKGVLRFKQGDVNGDHVVVLVTSQASNDYLGHLKAAGVSYLFSGREQIEPKKALRQLGKVLGLRKLLLEGGGTLNGAWLKAGLIDEISQVIVPIVDGGAGVAGFFDIPGPFRRKSASALQLIKHGQLAGGIQWNRYRVTAKA